MEVIGLTAIMAEGIGNRLAVVTGGMLFFLIMYRVIRVLFLNS
jgi:hypothetical protein